jgi:alcohol dehydrogenase
MKAAQFNDFCAPLEIVDIPDPELPPGGVVIKVKAAGICRSDWHAWQGHDPDIKSLPHVPGHEFSGIIEAIDPGIRQWQVGDRVTVPFACGCGTCRQCADGNTQVCPEQFQPGFNANGAFAEYIALPFAATNLIRIPDTISFASAASLGCRFATAYRALAHPDQAALKAGEKVVILGCGGVGLSAVMIAHSLGAEVIAVDIRPEALAYAAGLGATATFHPDEITNLSVQVSVDAIGSAKACAAAIKTLAPRGRHVQVGLLLGEERNPPLPMDEVIARELRIIGSHGMGVCGYRELLDRIAEGKLNPSKIVTSRIALGGIPATMTAMSTFENPCGMTIVDRFD